ncbi:MAG: transposase [Nanoarchaeota archaeon]
MARKPRIQYEGAFYHIIVRGNQRQDIFLDDEDRDVYLEKLQRYHQKCGFILYAYVLMSNHVHLLMETPKDPISRIMQMINFTYTQYFNRRYGKVGHLFQGRYKSFLCDKNACLLALVRYIHNNPVRAGLVKHLEQYRWSSHDNYIHGGAGLVEAEQVLRLFSEKPRIARQRYREFIEEAQAQGTDKEKIYQAVGQQIVGDDKFIEKVEMKLNQGNLPVKKLPLKKVVSAVEEVTGIGFAEMTSRKRGDDLRIARSVLVAITREMGYTMAELQGLMERDISVLSRLSNNAETAECQKVLRQVKENIIA